MGALKANQNSQAQNGYVTDQAKSINRQANNSEVTVNPDMPSSMLEEVFDTNLDYSNKPNKYEQAQAEDKSFSDRTLRTKLGMPEPEYVVFDGDDIFIKTDKKELENKAENLIKVLPRMYEYNIDLNTLKEKYPEVYTKIIPVKDGDIAEDFIVHTLSEAVKNKYPKDSKKAQELLNTQLKFVFDDNKLQEFRERASVYNRFSNGAALTLAQAWNGIDNFLSDVGMSAEDPVAGIVEQELAKMTRGDKALYEALNFRGSNNLYAGSSVIGDRYDTNEDTKSATDFATQVGSSLPYVAAGISGGYARQLSKGATIADVALADAVSNILLTTARSHSDTANITPLDYATDVLGTYLGYKMTPKGYARVQTSNKALREAIANPEGLQKLRTTLDELDKYIEVRDYEVSDTLVKARDYLKGKDIKYEELEGYLDYLFTQFRTNKGKSLTEGYIMSEVPTEIQMTDRGFRSQVVDRESITYQDEFMKGLTKDDKDYITLVDTAKNSQTPSEFLNNIKNSKNASPELKKWATNILKEQGTEAFTRYGINGLLLFFHAPAGAVASVMTSPTIKAITTNFIKNTSKKGIRGGAAGLVKDLKKTTPGKFIQGLLDAAKKK